MDEIEFSIKLTCFVKKKKNQSKFVLKTFIKVVCS